MSGTRTTIRLAATLVALLVALAVASASPAAGADSDPDIQFTLPSTTQTTWDALRSKAQAQGTVPVIVALAVKTKAPDRLAPGEEDSQRAAIAHARKDLLGDLKGKEPRSLKTSDEMPLIAFHADVDDLAKLERSKKVVAISEDQAIALDDVQHGDASKGRPGTPGDTAVTGPETAPAGTSSNGSANQLASWWDWYRVGVDKARGAGYTGYGQAVAVLDTGVDRNHPWLAGRIIAEACFSTTAVGGTKGNCPNGGNVQYGTGAAAPCVYSYDCAHGTHVAHTAAGQWGVASRAEIVAIQIFHCCGTSGRPTYWESDVVWGLSHVYNLRASYRIAAINMSIGGRLFSGYCDNAGGDASTNATYLTGWINALKGVGIATVISSGNNNASTQLSHPSCISGAISVGNTTDVNGGDAVFGGVINGSNSNATLDLLAPGTDICSAVPTWLDNDGVADGIACSWIGTSMAAPHVTGAIAVLKAYRPGATVDQELTALRLSGPGVVDSRNGVNRTRINVWNALGRI